MPMNTANNLANAEKWNGEQKAAFNEFKKRRRSPPSPPDVDGTVNSTPKKTK